MQCGGDGRALVQSRRYPVRHEARRSADSPGAVRAVQAAAPGPGAGPTARQASRPSTATPSGGALTSRLATSRLVTSRLATSRLATSRRAAAGRRSRRAAGRRARAGAQQPASPRARSPRGHRRAPERPKAPRRCGGERTATPATAAAAAPSAPGAGRLQLAELRAHKHQDSRTCGVCGKPCTRANVFYRHFRKAHPQRLDARADARTACRPSVPRPRRSPRPRGARLDAVDARRPGARYDVGGADEGRWVQHLMTTVCVCTA